MLKRPIAAAFACLALAAPAAAQRAGLQDRLAAALDTAVKEHEVFLNCSATDRPAHLLIRRGWDDMVREAIAALEAAKADDAIVKQYRERTDAEKMIRREARFGDILELCNGDWMDRAIKLNYLLLNVRVKEILDAK